MAESAEAFIAAFPLALTEMEKLQETALILEALSPLPSLFLVFTLS